MQPLDRAAATLMRRQWLVGEALDHLKHLTALATLIFVHWHVGFLVSSYCLVVNGFGAFSGLSGFAAACCAPKLAYPLSILRSPSSEGDHPRPSWAVGRSRGFLSFFGIDEGLGLGDEDGRCYACVLDRLT